MTPSPPKHFCFEILVQSLPSSRSLANHCRHRDLWPIIAVIETFGQSLPSSRSLFNHCRHRDLWPIIAVIEIFGQSLPSSRSLSNHCRQLILYIYIHKCADRSRQSQNCLTVYIQYSNMILEEKTSHIVHVQYIYERKKRKKENALAHLRKNYRGHEIPQ